MKSISNREILDQALRGVSENKSLNSNVLLHISANTSNRKSTKQSNLENSKLPTKVTNTPYEEALAFINVGHEKGMSKEDVQVLADVKYGSERELKRALKKEKLNSDKEEEKHRSRLEIWQTKKKRNNKGIYENRNYIGNDPGEEICHSILWNLINYRNAYGEGNIRPSIGTIAKEAGVCHRTASKHLHVMRFKGEIDWISGKKTCEPNSYKILIPTNQVVFKPYGAIAPRKVKFKCRSTLEKPWHKVKKGLKNLIYMSQVCNFAHHILRIKIYIRILIRKIGKISNNFGKSGGDVKNSSGDVKNSGVDPPKTPKISKKPKLLKILDGLRLSLQDRYVISNYGEFAVRKSLDDLNWYTGQLSTEGLFDNQRFTEKDGEKKLDLDSATIKNLEHKEKSLSQRKENVVRNKAAFLVSRCKFHKSLNSSDIQNPGGRVINCANGRVINCVNDKVINCNVEQTKSDKIKSYLKNLGDSVVYTNNLKNIPPDSKEKRPFINFLIHKTDENKSIIHVRQKVCNNWIDKTFNFLRPDLFESIRDYLGNSLQNLKYQSS